MCNPATPVFDHPTATSLQVSNASGNEAVPKISDDQPLVGNRSGYIYTCSSSSSQKFPPYSNTKTFTFIKSTGSTLLHFLLAFGQSLKRNIPNPQNILQLDTHPSLKPTQSLKLLLATTPKKNHNAVLHHDPITRLRRPHYRGSYLRPLSTPEYVPSQ
jgi:hypothetical protein